MKKILLMSVVALLFVACNKNQKVVKQLDGTWNATSYLETWDGSTEEYITDGYTMTWDFDNCKLKDDEFCNITWTDSYEGEGSDVLLLQYRVAGYGTSLELRDSDYPSELIYLKITEQTKTTLVIEIDQGDGDTIKISFEKA